MDESLSERNDLASSNATFKKAKNVLEFSNFPKFGMIENLF